MTNKESVAEASRISLDDAAQDLFGLNVRGLKTIRTAWSRPAEYFKAARTPDWRGIYTPSIRLYVSLLAVFSLLKVWWIASGTPIVGAFAEGYRSSGVILPEGHTYESLGKEAAIWIFSLSPIALFIALLLLSLAYPFWGRPTGLAVRQRYLFAAVIPSASITPFWMTGMMFLPVHLITPYSLLMAVIAVILDTTTMFRARISDHGWKGRLWRSLLLAMLIVIISIVVNVGSQFVGIIYIASKYNLIVG